MTLSEIASAVDGTVRDADPALMVTGPACYDSREIEPGGLFVAFPGERVDGHDFAARAMAGGAAAVLAGRPVGVPAVVVDDVQAAFGRLAAAIVERAPGLTVIGVTGSVGKTTTNQRLARRAGDPFPGVRVRWQWQPGDVVLVKGSNDTGLQSLARSLTARSGE